MDRGINQKKIDDKYKAYSFVCWAPDNILKSLVENIKNTLLTLTNETEENIKVLDFGTGYGVISGKIAEKLSEELPNKKIHWYVIDIDKNALEFFRNEFCKNNSENFNNWKRYRSNKIEQNLFYYFPPENTIDVESQDFEDFITNNSEQFHLVFASWFFHHLVRWKRALALAYKALKDGGILTIQWSDGVFRYYDGRVFQAENDDTPIYRFWRRVWKRFVEETGFNWVEMMDIHANDYEELKDFLREFDELWKEEIEEEYAFDIEGYWDNTHGKCFKNLWEAYETLLRTCAISPLKVVKFILDEEIKEEHELFVKFRPASTKYENLLNDLFNEKKEENTKNSIRGLKDELMKTKTEKRKWCLAIFKKKGINEESLQKKDFDFYLKQDIQNKKERDLVLKKHLLRCLEDFNKPIILPPSEKSKTVLNQVIASKLIYPLMRENLLPENLIVGFANIKLDDMFFVTKFFNPFSNIQDQNQKKLFKKMPFTLYQVFKIGKSFSAFILEYIKGDTIILKFLNKSNSKDNILYYKYEGKDDFNQNDWNNWKIEYKPVEDLPRASFILEPVVSDNDKEKCKKNCENFFTEVNYWIKSHKEKFKYEGTLGIENKEIEEIKEPYIVIWIIAKGSGIDDLSLWIYASKIVNEYVKDKLRELGTGAMLLVTRGDIEEQLERILKTALEVFYSKISIWKWREQTKHRLISGNAQNNAIAIVARNFSHHFGSHIIEMLKRDINEGKINEPEKLIPVLDYIKERAELTADLSARVPFAWGKGNLKEILKAYFEIEEERNSEGKVVKRLYKKIWDKFKEMIVEKMKGIESITIKIEFIEFKASKSEKEKNPTYQITENLNDGQISRSGDIPDIEIALPFGEFIGRHLIYAILENEFRNIEKYRFLPPGEKTLKINFDIEDRETYYRINVSSNARIVEDDSKIDNKIKEIEKLMFKDPKKAAFVDEEGRPITEAWGFKEMRLCSGLLAGFKFEEIILNPKLWKFLPRFEKKKAEKEKIFSFSFYLRKYEPLLVVKDKSDLRSLESRYIEEVTQEKKDIEVDEKEKDGIKIAPITGFLVIHPSEEVLEEIVKNRMRYPLRIVIAEDEEPGIDKLTEIYRKVYKSLLSYNNNKKLREWIKSQYIFLKNNIEDSDKEEKYVNLMEKWNAKKLQGDGSVEVEEITDQSIMLKYSTCTQHNCEEEWRHGPDYSSADTIVRSTYGLLNKGDFRNLPASRKKDLWFLLKSKVLVVDDRLYNNLVDNVNFDALARGTIKSKYRLIILPEKGTKIVKQNDDIMVVFEHNKEKISHKLSDFTIASFHLGFLEELKKNGKSKEFFDKGPENLDKFAKLMFIHTGRGKLSSEFENYFWFQKLFSYSDLEACTRSKRWLTVKLSLLHAFLWS